MVIRSGFFTRSNTGNVPPYWTFYLMPNLRREALCSQDVVHLLAKLRTRLLKPSNIIVMGTETACRVHLKQMLNLFPKSNHGLTQQVLENKDKQNYGSREILVNEGVKQTLEKMQATMKTKGTTVYLWIMRNIRDAFFDKAIAPIERVALMWKTIFFLRIWRLWLHLNGYSASDHFVTQNVYIYLHGTKWSFTVEYSVPCCSSYISRGLLASMDMWVTGMRTNISIVAFDDTHILDNR